MDTDVLLYTRTFLVYDFPLYFDIFKKKKKNFAEWKFKILRLGLHIYHLVVDTVGLFLILNKIFYAYMEYNYIKPWTIAYVLILYQL